MILNRLERDYGIDRVADIAMPWRKFETAKKLELAKQLEIELDTEAENNICGEGMKHNETGYQCNRSKDHPGCHVQWDRNPENKFPIIKAIWGGWK
jgi:hypothetical protein